MAIVKMRFNLVVLVLALCVVGSALPARAAGSQWIEVRSPHFSVITDGGEKRGRETALHFEQMRAVFASLLVKKNVNVPVPLQIIAFRNHGEMRAFSPLWNRKPVELAGFFQGSSDRNFIAVDLSAESGWSVVFHEYAHLLLNGNLPEMPAWFDEGFAEYYSTITVDKKEVQIGLAPPYVGYLLRQAPMNSVALFSTRHDSKAYNENGQQRTLFYAQSWLVVHYLFDLRKLNDAARYFNYVKQGLDVPTAIERGFGMPPKQFDKELQAFVNSTKFLLYRGTPPPGLNELQFAVRPLAEADANAVLADLHLHSPDYADQAVGEFEAVLKVQPEHAGAHRGLGYAYLRKGTLEKAGEHFRLAAAKNSDDAYVHYYSALLSFMQSRTGDAAQAEAGLRKALQLNPDFADAYDVLSWTHAARGDFKGAIESAERAVQLSPRNDKYKAALARYYLREQQWDKADALLKGLIASSNPAIAAGAHADLQMLAQLKERPSGVLQLRLPHASGSDDDDDREPELRHSEPPAAPPTPLPVKFEKGTLVATDCSALPTATLTIATRGATLKLRARDAKKLIVIGADVFSCDWSNKKVAVNYRVLSPTEGELISLEVQ